MGEPSSSTTDGNDTPKSETRKRKAASPSDEKKTHETASTDDSNAPASTTNTTTTMQPLFQEGEQPQKKFYRQRAHCNPLSHNDSFSYPIHPSRFDWTVDHYPSFANKSDETDEVNNNKTNTNNLQPTVLDVGCGFGGLTMALGELLPSTTLILGLEIRAKVTEYVRLRIVAARSSGGNNKKNKNGKDDDHDSDDNNKNGNGTHHNVSVMRTNTQKFLPNYFRPRSLEKLFFCFPDPHFKRKNHPRRIISERLLAEYAYLLQPGTGLLYCITDVKELHDWHVSKCDAYPLLQRIPPSEADADPCVQAMRVKTEEGQKVERNRGSKYHAVYQRISMEQEETLSLRVTASNFFGSVETATTTTTTVNGDHKE